MAQKFESYATHQEFTCSLRDGYSWGQTFTPQATHKITLVKLFLQKIGAPPNNTLRIRATAGGLPIGGDLCTGVLIGTAPPAPPGGWVDIPIGNGVLLIAGIMYAMVFSGCAGDMANQVTWWYDGSGPTYAGGTGLSHPEWTKQTGWDMWFEEWGDPLQPPGGHLSRDLVKAALI